MKFHCNLGTLEDYFTQRIASIIGFGSIILLTVIKKMIMKHACLKNTDKNKAPPFLELEVKSTRNRFGKLLNGVRIDEVYLCDIITLSSIFPSAEHSNTGWFRDKKTQMPYHKMVRDMDCVFHDIVRQSERKNPKIHGFIRAGPRAITHFDPKYVTAAVVTCGGLCPGLNNVIREIVHSLNHLYGVKKVIGIRGGYNGFTDPAYKPIILTVENTANCHHEGGTILASSRGGFNVDKIIAFLQTHGINQLYVIGGDGTHRGAYIISQECVARGLNVSVVGIPKTIDNDVDLIDRSFGFQTAVEAAQGAILSAHTEAQCNLPNGIGIVKLMGRSAGFIAVHAVLASGDVDLCLVPEVSIELEGDNGCLPFIMKRVETKGYAVIVVAEGAGEELLGEKTASSDSQSRVFPAFGDFIKKKVIEYFAKYDKPATVKYIDPSYMIRSGKANASDALYCMLLAQNAVHGAMAGYTGFTVGLVNNHLVYIPMPNIVATSPRVLNPLGRTWDRLLAFTRQPDYKPKAIHDYAGKQD
eukprot:gene9324-19352_t